MSSLLALNGLCTQRGRKTLSEPLTWSLGPGVHGLLGPNGAGKSTLIETLATLIRPGSGNFSVNGSANVRKSIGYLQQDNLPKSRFTARSYLEYMAWLREIRGRNDAVQEAAHAADVTGLLSTRIDKLSGTQRDHFSAFLEQIRATTCVILCTHIVEDLVGVADTITVLDGGSVRLLRAAYRVHL